MAGIWASNSRDGLTLRWSGYGGDDAVIEDKNIELDTYIPSWLLEGTSNPRFIGNGNKDAYEGFYILLTPRTYNGEDQYNLRLIEPGVGHWGNGGLAKDLNPYYAGFEKAVLGDLNGDGVIEGISGIYVSDASVEEGDAGSFDISRTGDLSFALTLNVKSIDDNSFNTDFTAQSGIDYLPLNTSVTFESGETEKKIHFNTIADNLITEGIEQFEIEVTTADPDVLWQNHIIAESYNYTSEITINDGYPEGYIITPLITGPSGVPGDESGDVAVFENKTFIYDFDANSPAIWSISGDDSGKFDIEAETGVLSFIAPGDFLKSNDRNGDNIYNVDVIAGESIQSISISIKDDPADNFAPAVDFGPEDIVIRLSKGNGSNTLLSGDSRFSIWEGDWGAGRASDHLQLRDRFTGALTLIDATKDGIPSTGDSEQVLDLSSDGRYALLTLDEYGSVDLDGLPGKSSKGEEYGNPYRKDIKTGDIVPVNTLANGEKVAAGASNAVMSSDGRFVAFTSDIQLAGFPKPEWGSDDRSRTLVYRKDLLTGELLIASSQSDGTPGEGWASSGIGISDDGSKVSFIYRGNDLVEGTNPDPGPNYMLDYSPGRDSDDVYLKDFNTGNVVLASSNSEGEQIIDFGQSGSGAHLSPDGTKVIFTSKGNNNNAQLYMKDVFTEDLILLSKNASGEEGNGYSQEAVFSDDGKYIAYVSSASNLAGLDPEWEEPKGDQWYPPGMEQDKYIDKNNKQDVFIYELSSGITKRLLNDIANDFTDHIRNPNISGDGKYVSFSSRASGILPGGQGSEVYLALNPFNPIENDSSSTSGTNNETSDNLMLDLEYKLFGNDGTGNSGGKATAGDSITNLAAFGAKTDDNSTYSLNIYADTLNSAYDLESADIVLKYDNALFDEITAADITFGDNLTVAQAIEVDDENGLIRIAAGNTEDLGTGGYSINGSNSDGALFASIKLNLTESYFKSLYRGVNGRVSDSSGNNTEYNPIRFELSANRDQTIFSTHYSDGTGQSNRAISSLTDLSGNVTTSENQINAYEAIIDLNETGNGLVLGTKRVIGAEAGSFTNLIRSGDTISAITNIENRGNTAAEVLSVSGISDGSGNINYVSSRFVDASGLTVSSVDLSGGTFAFDTSGAEISTDASGANLSTFTSSGANANLEVTMKVTGDAGDVIDLQETAIFSVTADNMAADVSGGINGNYDLADGDSSGNHLDASGSHVEHSGETEDNSLGSKNLITYQGDLNYDGRVSMKDLAYLNAGAARQTLDGSGNYATEESYARDVDADFNGRIDLADLAVLDADWGNSLHSDASGNALGGNDFAGSSSIAWKELSSQFDPDSDQTDASGNTWSNDPFTSQNGIENENGYVESFDEMLSSTGTGTNLENSINSQVFHRYATVVIDVTLIGN